MKVTVCGSLNNKSIIEDVYTFAYKVLGANYVHYPIEEPDIPLVNIRKNFIDHIVTSDLVIVIPKNYFEFGDSVTWELAIARYLKKPVLIWAGDNTMKTLSNTIYGDKGGSK